MKQRLLIVVIGGFFAHYIFQYLAFLLEWYISVDGGTVYDYWQMGIYFAASGAALFSLALVLSVILVVDEITRVSCSAIGYATLILAFISTIIAFGWGKLVVQKVIQTDNFFNSSWLGEVVVVHFPFVLTILICIFGVRYVVSKTS